MSRKGLYSHRRRARREEDTLMFVGIIGVLAAGILGAIWSKLRM